MGGADRVSEAHNWRRPAFEPEAAGRRRRARMSATRNGSQVARAPGTMGGKSFVRERIKLAGADIPRNGGIKLLRVECFNTRAKACKLARGRLFDRVFDVFCGGHVGDIAFAQGTEKSAVRGTTIIGAQLDSSRRSAR